MKKEKHLANIELAKLIKENINTFFEEENENLYLQHFTKEEAEKLRNSSYGKKNVAIIDKLAEVTGMTSKTFYHMLNGKNSQFDKIVEVADFFELEVGYVLTKKSEKSINEYATEKDYILSEKAKELIEIIGKSEDEKLEAVINLLKQFKNK